MVKTNKHIQEEFRIFEYKLKDGTIQTIKSENIFEAMEQIVRFCNIHPTKIESISEKNAL